MKVGFWLRNGNGKLAGATVYQQNGETVMREVVTPKNPNTTPQIIQRVIMHTIMSAYSKMKEICDHSYEGTEKGQKTMSLFMKENIQLCRQKIASMQAEGVDFYDIYNFIPLGAKGFVANQYLISMGSLPQVGVSLNGSYDTEMILPGVSTMTYQGIIDAYGLQRGDQLTFLMLKHNGNVSDINAIDFKFARVILDPTDPTTHLPLPLSTAFLTEDRHINAPSIRNENADVFGFRYEEGTGLCVSSGDTKKTLGGCVIVSRQTNDLWQRSTAYLQYVSGFGVSLGQCMDQAANGVQNVVYSANSQYLNNAGEGGGTAAATGEGSDAGTGSGDASSVPTLSSVTLNGASATVGTLRTLSVVNGTSFPYSVAVVATGGNLGGHFLVVKNGDTEVSSMGFNNGSATLNISAAKDTVYTVEVQNEDSEAIVTGYSFKVEELPADDPGNDDPPANDH